MASREELAWASGLFEGEGSISWNRGGGNNSYGHGYLNNAGTDEDVIRRFHEVMGIGHLRGPRDMGPGRKPMWFWSAGSFEHVQAGLAMMWPWLCSRRRSRAVEVMRMWAEAQAIPRVQRRARGLCEDETCERSVKCVGLCGMHYQRMLKRRHRERTGVSSAL